MKYLAFIVTILTSAWVAAAGVVIYGNFTPTDSPVSFFPHVEPHIDAPSVLWTTSKNWERRCAAPKIEKVTKSLYIFKADCDELVKHFLDHNGYWTINGYKGCGDDLDPGRLGFIKTCALGTARIDGKENTDFYVGNRDAAIWLQKTKDVYTDKNLMGTTIGSDTCQSKDSTDPKKDFASACFRVFPKE
ncbi:hypothetical protein PG984_007136 [Apiospora sp. TS-2023a]